MRPTLAEHEAVSRLDIREVVRDDEWQALRGSLVGTWSKEAVANVARLRAYLQAAEWDALRWRRVHNYLTGTAFRLGKISHPDVAQLLEVVRRERTKKVP